jgi:ribosomal protein L11 methylase PrmA
MENIKWFGVEILVKTEATEAIESALNELDALGTEIDILGQKQTQENTKVVGYFNEIINEEILRNKLYEFLEIYGFQDSDLGSITWQEIENKDWLAEWKKTWKPTHTKNFVILQLGRKLLQINTLSASSQVWLSAQAHTKQPNFV